MMRILSIALLLFSVNAFSAEVEKLYEATVMAKNDLTLEKQIAFKQVLIRVTGEAEPTKNSLVNQSLLDVTDYIVQFQYLDVDGKQHLWVQFDPKQVKQLLRKAQLPVWGQHRPQAIFWIAREDKYGRDIVSDGEQSNVKAALQSRARLRGLPLVLPLLDLNDSSVVSSSDVWGKFTQPVLKASKRYDADVVVMANMYPISENQWLLNWDLLGRQGGSYASLAKGEIRNSEQGVVQNLVDKVSQKLAKIYAVNLAEKSNDMVSLKIKGIQTLDDYVAVSRLLSKLSAISQRKLARILGDKFIWELRLLAGEQDLMRALALDPRLEFYSQEPATQIKSVEQESSMAVSEISPDLISQYPVLYYHWIKE